MDPGRGIKINITENTGKTVKVLILTPAPRRPFKDLRRQFVCSLSQIRAQKKLRGRKTVLAVPHKMSVQPERDPALRSLKGNIEPFSVKSLRHFKILYITCHRIKPLRYLPRHNLLPAVPRILHIRVLGHIIPFHLDMGRHSDILPVSAVILRLFKARYHISVIYSIMKFPDPV